MTDSRKMVGKIGLVGIANIIGRITMILLVPILTKSLSVEDYGLWVIVVATIGLIPSVATLGLSNALMRFLPAMKENESKREIFYSIALLVLVTSGLISLGIFAIAGPVSIFVLKSDLAIAQLLALIVLIESILSICLSFFNGILKIRIYSSIIISKNILNLVFIGIIVGQGQGIVGAVIGLALSDVVVTLFAIVMIIKEIGISLPSFRKLREYLSFSLPIVPTSLSSWIVRSSDRYIIGLFLGAAFVAFYSPAYTLGDVILMYSAPITIILFPTLSRYYDEHRISSLEKTLGHSLKYFFALGIPTVFGLSMLSFPLLNILTTYEIAINGYYITPIVCLGCLFWGSLLILSQVLIVAKKTKIIGTIWVGAAIINLTLNLILIPIVGIIGAAFTTLLAFAVSSLVVYMLAKREVRIDLNAQFIVKSVFASLVMSSILIFWQTTDLLLVIIEILICAVVYFAVLLLIRGFSKEEISFFIGLVVRSR